MVKILAKMVILLAVMAICLPVKGEILVYSKTLKCWEATEGENWDITKQTVKGYLVLDVTYNDDGEIEALNSAYQVEYGRNNSREKIYTEVEHNFDIIRVVVRNRIEWVLVETDSDDSGGEMTMVRGRAAYYRIGSTGPNEVAKSLSGNRLGYWNDGGTENLVMCEWSLRFKEDWTRWINEDEQTIGEALDNIELWLEARGYNPGET